MRKATSIAAVACVLGGCSSAPERERGVATMLQGDARSVAAPGATWEVRAQALVRPDAGRPLADPWPELVSAVPGQRLLFRRRSSRRRFACQLLGETFTRTLTADGDASAPVVSGRRWAVVTVERIPGGLRGYEMTLLVGDVRTGRLLRRLRVARADFLEPGDVAISPRGDVAVSWFRPRPERNGTSYGPDAVVSVLEAGRRRLSRPEVVTRDAAVGGFLSYYGSLMAFGREGDLVIAEQDFETRVRVRPPCGRRRAARRVTGRVRSLQRPFVTRAGRVIISWSGRSEAGLASARLGNGAFGRPQRLFTAGRPAEVRAAPAAHGATAVAWSTRTQTRIATLGANGRLGPRHTVRGAMRALAAAPDGQVLLVTAEHPGRALRAHLRPAGGSPFGAPQRVAGTQNAFDALAAFTPVTGKAVVMVLRSERTGLRQALVIATRK